jgi:di/tricarboxylate transporter
MTDPQTILVILAATIVMFLWGRWRHDMVAMASLLACVVAGLVPAEHAFAGFGHPAVVTVASVLILSRALLLTGAVDALAHRLLPVSGSATLSIAALTVVAAAMSAFMNNVGALALMMPLAIQVAAKHELPPGKVLMPLAFASILGGMTTLIGTPPNLIVSGFRAGTPAGAFGMFDFTPVGLAIAGVGVAFVALFGCRIVPTRREPTPGGFDTGTYLTEVRVRRDGKADGKSLHEIEMALDQADAQVVGMVRNDMRVFAPHLGRVLQADDVLVIEAEPKSLGSALSSLGLTMEENVSAGEAEAPASETTEAKRKDARGSKDGHPSELLELAVLPDSSLIGSSATIARVRTRFGINLLALSRQGRRSIKRLRSTPIVAGDVLLM